MDMIPAGEEMAPDEPPRLSVLLADLSLKPQPRITLGEIADAMADRSFGAFLVVFCIPNLIPMPPGATLLLGLPLILITWQIVFSRQPRIWMPGPVAGISFSRPSFANGMKRAAPWLKWAETLIRPRYWALTTRSAERWFGIFCLILAILVFLPIPFGNWLPALALTIIGLAMTERDGLSLVIGVLIGIVSLVIAAIVVFASIALIRSVFFSIV